MKLTSVQTYQTIDGGNPISDLLDMIARRAPLLMRVGGGGSRREYAGVYRHMTDLDREQIIEMFHQQLTFKEIADRTKWSVKTIWKATLHLPRRPIDRCRRKAA